MSTTGGRKISLDHPVQRVEVTDPVAEANRPYDYADAFELELATPDGARPEDWVRLGMAQVPALVKWIARGFSRGRPTPPSPHMIGDLRIVASTPEVLHLAGEDRLMRTVLVARRLGPTGRRFTTVLQFRRPLFARVAWAVIAPLHRRTARRLLGTSTFPPANGAASTICGTASPTEPR